MEKLGAGSGTEGVNKAELQALLAEADATGANYGSGTVRFKKGYRA